MPILYKPSHPWPQAHELSVRLALHDGGGKIESTMKIKLPYKVEREFFTGDGGIGRKTFRLDGKSVILIMRCIRKREDFLLAQFADMALEEVGSPEGKSFWSYFRPRML